LQEAIGKDVRFVDGAGGIARRVAQLTENQAFIRTSEDIAVTTGLAADFGRLGPALSRLGIERVEEI